MRNSQARWRLFNLELLFDNLWPSTSHTAAPATSPATVRREHCDGDEVHSVDYSQQTGCWHVSKLFPMLGNELRKARERAKKTQEQLAFDADVDRTYISMLENDKKSPTVEMLFRLCESMDVAINIVTLQLLPQAAYRTWLG